MGIRWASRGPAQTADGASRRQFLRRAGITGALTAGLLGTAEVTGLSSALASPSQPRGHQAKRSCGSFCKYTYSPGHCGPNGAKCPPGSCCFYQSGGCCTNRYNCIVHSCTNFEICCH